ncbi:hypothetical protein ACWDO5_35440, partial [Streptomyces sp. NPDC000880]
SDSDHQGGGRCARCETGRAAKALAQQPESKPPNPLTPQKLSHHARAAPPPAQGTDNAAGGACQRATLKAPLDYAKPDGETINVALIRTKAMGQDQRTDSLLFTFGGPGASGVSVPPARPGTPDVELSLTL